MQALSPLLLVISLDAFMFEYFNKSSLHLPNFDYLQRRGILSALNPLFTSKTLPNHWAMATGLFEESSNIVGNQMYDPHLGFFNFPTENGSEINKWFSSRYSGQPIWVSNERVRNDIRKSGVYMWPASPIAHFNKSYSASHVTEYNASSAFDFHLSVDTVVDWMSSKGVNFAMLYFPLPDRDGHKFGPFAPEVLKTVEQIDDGLGYLIKQLKGALLWEKINVLILSDHGMVEIKEVLDVSSISNDSDVVVDDVILQVQPKRGKTETVLSKLKKIPHCTVYRKEDIPLRYHFNSSERILPIVAVPDEGYVLSLSPETYKKWHLKGQHGYDPRLKSMQGIFLASGPAFKSGIIRKEPILIVDAHALMAHVLGASVPPNNGSLDRVSDVLNLNFYDLYPRIMNLDSPSVTTLKLNLSSFSVWIMAAVVLCAVAISLVYLIRIVINRQYTVLSFRRERTGMLPLHSQHIRRSPGKTDSVAGPEYSPLSTSPDNGE